MSRLKDLFKKSTNESAKTEEINEAQFGPSVPEGLWVKCPKCGELLYKEDVVKNSYVCPKCQGYFRMPGLYAMFILISFLHASAF